MLVNSLFLSFEYPVVGKGGYLSLNSCVVEESRDKQAERICNKNTHVWAQIIGDDDNAHFLKIGRRHAAPGWQRTKKVFKIHLVSLDRIIYKRILNNILIYWHQVNLWELCLFTERIKDFKRNYLSWLRKVMIYLQPLFLSFSVRYTTKIIQFFYLKRLQAMEFE